MSVDLILSKLADVDPNVLIASISAILLALVYLLVQLSSQKKESPLIPYMLGLATGNPRYKVSQQDAVKIALKAPGCEGLREILPKIYANSKITSRFLAVPDFTPELKHPDDDFFYPADGTFSVPVQDRMQKFKDAALPLVVDVCKKAIADAKVSVADIHKLILVTSTGFIGPSLDCELIVALGLPRSVDRSLVSFMGCAAAMNGYRIAMDFVKAHPGQLALMVCVEISSVHTTFKETVNDAIIHGIFADGAAACVLTAKQLKDVPKGTLAIVDDHACLMEGTQDGIQLHTNDDGISCTLSKFLPQYISKNIGPFVDALLTKQQLSRKSVDFWAIHPGGRRIIEEAQIGIGLTDAQAADSWYVLDNYGNMLSPSVMFVLERVFRRHREAIAAGKEGYNCGVAFSFSPGVGAEGIILRQIK
jgi:alpha-pyrone synthase